MRVGIIDLLGKRPAGNTYSRFVRANNASIMPQVIGVWCEELGHRVSIAYYSGWQKIAGGLPEDLDVLFVNSFTQAAVVAYALSARFRSLGVVTVLGGPHARAFPEDACRYFDYVIGFCTPALIRDLLGDLTHNTPVGQYLSAEGHPASLPGLQRRWKFLAPVMELPNVFRMVPIIGSLGCPYTCGFCVDATVRYQTLDFEELKADLRFFRRLKLPRACLIWHDPNFGVRFDDYLDAVEEAVPPGSVISVAESSLSLLKEANLKRLQLNGFRAIAPGIESWFGLGEKSKLRSVSGAEKVSRTVDVVRTIQRYIPYVQCNLIFGLDVDEGAEPFELTKRFVDLAPGVYPYFSLLTSFGRNAPDDLVYLKDHRVLPVPFHFLDTLHAMNVKPQHYGWEEFYTHVCEVFAHAFSARSIVRRAQANQDAAARFMLSFRAVSAERHNRLKYHRAMRGWLGEPDMRRFFDGEPVDVPPRLVGLIRADLGPLWSHLPAGALKPAEQIPELGVGRRGVMP